MKEYHDTDIHFRLLKSIALNVEMLYNDKDSDINEYDVQAFMTSFLRRNLRNTDFIIYRETFGKYDCSIALRKTKKPQVLYELKTFSKPQEKLNIETSFKKIQKDIFKLKDGINKYKTARGYFILVCQKRDIHKVEFIENLKFIGLHSEDSKEWTTFENEKCKLRPSRKLFLEGVAVFSWEIK